MRPLRFVFNWIAILTLPVWFGTVALVTILLDARESPATRNVLTGRKWIWEL